MHNLPHAGFFSDWLPHAVFSCNIPKSITKNWMIHKCIHNSCMPKFTFIQKKNYANLIVHSKNVYTNTWSRRQAHYLLTQKPRNQSIDLKAVLLHIQAHIRLPIKLQEILSGHVANHPYCVKTTYSSPHIDLHPISSGSDINNHWIHSGKQRKQVSLHYQDHN